MAVEARMVRAVQNLRSSYWFLPSLLVAAGIVLAVVVGIFDRNPDLVPFDMPRSWIDTQADGARVTLSVIAQAMLGVAGVMFSMTIVAVSFASGNFGPRLIGNFMRDRANQWSLGVMFATFAFCLIALRSVQDEAGEEILQFVPQFSIIVAMILAGICLFTLIFFVHHIPESINVSRISAGLGARLVRAVRDRVDQSENLVPPERAWPERPPEARIPAPIAGYVQTVQLDRLARIAEEHDMMIAVVASPGDFVTNAATAFEIWSPVEPSDKVLEEIEDCIAMGSRRTEDQNPSFLAEQLVEMAARALSPGVNDPYTAMECLNWMAAALTEASCYHGGLRDYRDGPISVERLTFERLFAASFAKCRQYVAPDDLARKRAIALLEDLRAVARPVDRDVIEGEIASLLREANEMGRPMGAAR